MSNAPRGGGRGGRGGGHRGRGDGGPSRGGSDRGGSRGGHSRGGSESYSPREPEPTGVFGNGTFPPPSPEVKKLEDDYVQQKAALGQALSLKQDFPMRPAYGTRGKPVQLWANYFDLNASKNLVVYLYSVNVQPEAKGRKLRRVFELLTQESLLAGCATDFKSFLVTRTNIGSREYEVPYKSDFEDLPPTDARVYICRVQEAGQIEVAALLNHLKSNQIDPNFSPGKQLQVIQILNILLGHYPQANPNTTTIAGNKHFSFGTNPVETYLGGGLTALRGYFRSVRMGTARLLVNVNVSHAVFFKAGPLVDLINEFASAYGRNPYQLQKFLKKVRVETTHLPIKRNKAGEKIPRIKTILSLATPGDGHMLPHAPQIAKFAASSKELKFWLESTPSSSKQKANPSAPGYTTVFDFFKKTHNLTIKAADMPLLNLGTKENPLYMPAEYCHVLPGQASMKTLSPDQTASMIRFACRRPVLNATSITADGPKVLGLLAPSNPLLVSFGISVNPTMITVPGRVLNAPAIKYRGTDKISPRGGSWNMIKIKFTTGASLPPWTYLWIKRAGKPGQIERNNLIEPVMAQFQQVMNQSGLNAPAPVTPGPVIILDDPKSKLTNDQLIVDMIQRISVNPKKIGLLVVLYPDTDAHVYSRVKYAADVLYGIHSVGSVDSKLAKENRRDQYLANIALKVNCKLRGINQSLDMSLLGIISEGKTMVVGIDVTHPSPGSLSSAPSVAALVASTDKFLSQFPCELRIQEGRKEMVADLREMLRSRLNVWKAKNKILPENILVYRDGVSEGQYQILLKDEVPLLRDACRLTYPADQTKKGIPKISVIVVGKRHHTRFYATKDHEADRSGNPMNGTVVDRGVTNMWNWDFFLQAHTCLQGTAKPAHYYVVLDEIFGKGNLKKPHPYPNAADTLEDLTHNMCYLFARATKAVSICPPAYYADLACERARCYLSGLFDPSATGGSTATGGTQTGASASDVTIHERLRESMFYL
ncbi:MAG: hypothetical protein M1829_003178 [Trizodia sp. TS-e1964]|nr:MAG: hypothetical protein M1829_003178 [Trizodia sp. TS-e1964]